MPELPEVETLRRSLERHVLGDTFERLRVSKQQLREPIPTRTLRRRLQGQTIERLGRRAKYLLIDVTGGSTLVVHLGMSGRLGLAASSAPREPHEHVIFHLRSGRQLRFRDPRRFGLVLAVPTQRLASDRHFVHLGLEPLAAGFSGSTLEALAKGRRAPIKSFLMDARVVVGVGNIYACEALYRARIHPTRRVDRISSRRWGDLANAVVAVLEEAIAQGGTTLKDFANAEGEPGYFSVALRAYGREDQPCHRCATRIRRRIQSNRSTFYCPRCQR